jgi:hypothetical protein
MSVQFSDENPHEWNWDDNPERWTKHRARYIERTTEFDATSSMIIAWAEIGCSHHGIGSNVDVSTSTVRSRMDEIDAVDPTALLTRLPDEIEVKSPVGIRGTNMGGDDDE